ncbi:MAG: tyrosine-type recombinase/integrase, partial [Gammaproteobacteria bacterium]|nr:tyrosine-type recombinase/integrase [Gammaproteobacteria bacterium]
MATVHNTKPLSSRTVETMKPGDKIKSDTGENIGLRVKCGATGLKTFFYRYTSPITSKLVQVKIGNFPETSLAEARLKLQELKQVRRQGRCLASEAKEEKWQKQQEREQDQELELGQRSSVEKSFTVEKLVELYLTQYIEDRKSPSGKVIAGARKPKGQSETRRTLYGDVIPKLGEMPANAVTRKAVVDMVMAIVQRGANVQAGNVLRELSAAYEFAIGLGYFSDEFANPAILAKSSLRQAKMKLTHQRGKRVLPDTELVALLKWLPGSDYTATQNVLRFTLWTGCRTGEVCNAAWKDIDLKKRTFHIRESKTEVERYVQLPSQAVEFLKTLRLITGDYPFPS